MRKILTITLLLTFSSVFSQNSGNKIPEFLNNKEIRIIRSYDLGKSEVLRIFQLANSEWKYEFYKIKAKVNLELIKTIILSKENNYDEKLWLKILMTDIQHISDYKEISYKFKMNKELIFLENSWTIFFEQPVILDGEGFEIWLSDDKVINHINYRNPDLYMNIYPKIDELNSVVDLLTLIRIEFKIWEI